MVIRGAHSRPGFFLTVLLTHRTPPGIMRGFVAELMTMRRIVCPEHIVLEIAGETKEAAIVELLDTLHRTGRVRDRAAALNALLDRERKMSTGLQNGIAIPHAKTDSVDQVVAALGRKRGGIPFDSLDGQPARIILLTLCPISKSTAHIQFLAEASRALHHESARESILQAATAEDLVRIFEEAAAAGPG